MRTHFYFKLFSDNRLPDVSKRTERERKQIEQERARAMKWADMTRPEKCRKYFEPHAKYREKMINRIYKGVPDSMRGRLWTLLLRVDEEKEKYPGTYQKMKETALKHSPDIRQVSYTSTQCGKRQNLPSHEKIS